MDFSNHKDLPVDFLQGIMGEVQNEIDSEEPACLEKLRQASELEFRYEV